MDDIIICDKTHESALVLANAGVLAAKVIAKIAGNDISTAINGSVMTRDMLQTLVMRAVERKVMAAQA